MRTEILFEDEQVIVAAKPAGLAVQTAKVGQADMVSELKNHLKASYLGLVHRLDQPVEGVLVFGKTRAAAADLSGQLARGSLNKRYLAVVCGPIAAEEGRLEDLLRKTADGRAEIVPPEDAYTATAGGPGAGRQGGGSGAGRQGGPGAKKSVLRYKILADHRFRCNSEREAEENDGCVTIYLADICIETGRFHQIRAQMAHAGMPLLGDVKYGSESSRKLSAELSVRNAALCAYELCFAHPVTRRRMVFRIEPKGEIFRRFPDKLPK